MRKQLAALASGAALALFATAGAALALFGAAAVAEAALTQSVDIKIKVARADKNKTRGGLSLQTTVKIADDTGAKPAPLTHTTLRFPKGGVVNAKFFKKVSKSALESKGLSAAPAGAKLGTGTAKADARPVVPNPVDAKITLLNGEFVNGNPTLLIYAQPELGPILTLQAILKKQRGGPYGYVLDLETPPIPTLPGQPNASVIFFDATTLDKTVKKGGRKIHYVEGPILCNGTFFLLDGVFTYAGGITNTVYEKFTITGSRPCA